MMKLNRKIEYSLMALKHMSLKRSGELTTAKEISESYQAPFDATARVLQVMAQKGLLKSEQGATGGYQILKDLSEISLKDLMEIVHGPTEIAKCLQHGEAPCEIQKSCNIISPVTHFNDKLNQFYQSLSIQELVGQNRSEQRL